MTPELALQLGRAVTFVAGRGKTHAPRVLIGKDTRLSGYMLETGDRERHLRHGRTGHALRPDAHARDRAPDDEHAR